MSHRDLYEENLGGRLYSVSLLDCYRGRVLFSMS